jgi:XTP/dITP diphosphohydrolase
MFDTLLVATTNPGKVREIQRALDGVPVRLLTLRDLPPVEEPEETGATCADNAVLKARYYSGRAGGLVTVAEDSGMMVDALDGRPGVLSARYPGDTYADKCAGILAELSPFPKPWIGHFVCSLAVVQADQVLFACESSVTGEMVPPRGTNGFGYDPMFYYAPFGRTFGEASDAEKLSVSHRGQAFARLRDWLTTRS